MQNNNHRKIDFGAGCSIDDAVNKLDYYKALGALVYGEFNGECLYSDIDTLDSAYLKITGKTKDEYDEEMRQEHEKYEEEKKRHDAAIPELTKEWIEKGKEILDEEFHEEWIECVPIRLGDLYHGMELECCLNIVKELNTGCSLETAKSIIYNQGHSGMSFGLVCSMVMSFCKRGAEFDSYVR